MNRSSHPGQDRSRPDLSPPLRGAAGSTRDSRMTRLAGFAQRHHWTALVAWVVLLAAVTVAASAIGGGFKNGSDVSLPATESQHVADLLKQVAPTMTGDSVTVVLHDERGWNRDLDVAALSRELAAVDQVDAVTAPDPRQGTVSRDGTLAVVQIAVKGAQGGAPKATYQKIQDVAKARANSDLQVELAGKGIKKLEKGGGENAEGAGLLAALVILVLLLGSFLAATLPLITALLAVGTTIGLATFLSHLISIPDFTPSLLVLVGLGVGIDYALIVFSRYRTELLKGADRAQATKVALDTAGRSVLFAGASVIIAMLGMFTLGIPAFEGTVTAVALTVLVTMAASLTLLPALLTLFGKKLQKRVLKHAAKTGRTPGERWRRWAWLVQRAPWPALVASAGILVALALPVMGIRLGLGDAGTDPQGTTTRAAYDLVTSKLGPGANGPLLVLTQGTQAQAEAAHEQLMQTTGIVRDRVSSPVPLAKNVFMTRANPATGPQDAATADLVKRLRNDLPAANLVGGSTAANIDYSNAISQRFLLFIVAVVGVSALLLMTVFRSWVIAIKAAVFNLLSIGAALGAMKLVYQDGRLWADAGPIEAFMPVFIFAIVFGLSMDYEVFLLSRIRETWIQTGDARHAIREGIANTGGVITAAAAIMFAVFGSFALNPDRMLAQTGFAMAVAVLLDAVIIRCLMVPAVMQLLGRRAWHLPRALDRVLPHLHVEGQLDPPIRSGNSRHHEPSTRPSYIELTDD